MSSVRNATCVGGRAATPSALRAVAATVATTRVSYGSGLAGSKTRTVSSSANVTLPLTALPSAGTLKASFVAVRSIGSAEADRDAAWRGHVLRAAGGRKRTTAGAAAVLTAMATRLDGDAVAVA